jgi:hypothetical protein
MPGLRPLTNRRRNAEDGFTPGVVFGISFSFLFFAAGHEVSVILVL